MADPFEVRMRFTSQLQHLNASVNSSQKAAQYALKNKDMDEDLHSCILEQLERNSMNNRANIMFFIEHLCEMANTKASEGDSNGYVDMMRRDMQKVVDAVAPSDGSGAANVKVARKVILSLGSKTLLPSEQVAELEARLANRGDTADETAPGDPSNANSENGISSPQRNAARLKKSNGAVRLDVKQIEQRLEEDRERHKRLRESMWAVSGRGDDEFNKMWEETSDAGEDDYLAAKEDAAEREAAARSAKRAFEGGQNGNRSKMVKA